MPHRLLCNERTAEDFISTIRLHAEDGIGFCRPDCLTDVTDTYQIEELVRLEELTKCARERGMQVLVEGPGHGP